MKKVCIFLSIILLSTTALAQKGTIKGRIYDAKSNHPIEFATIVIQGTTTGSTSDLEGNYIFTGIEPGFKRIVVNFLGYETTASAEFQVQGNQISYIDVGILESSKELAEVTIRQNISLKKIESPLSLIKIGIQEIEKGAGTNRDVSKAVQVLPGVGATNPNRNDLIVRGGGPSENVFYLDGVEIPVINHFATQGSSGGSVGVINPDFVREIDFYTGAFPANRGNALSSVMEIRQRDGSKDGIHSKISIGASDAGITLEGPIGKKSTFIASARQSYLQLLFSLIGLPFLPTYTDFQVKNKISFNTDNELTFIVLGAIDDMVLNTGIKNPTESQRYLLASLPIYKQWNYTIGTVYKHYSDNHFDTWVLSRNMLRNSNFKYQNNDENLPKTSNYFSDEAENKLRFERSYPDLPVKLLFGFGLKSAHYTNQTFRQFYANGKTNELNYKTNLNLFGYQAFIQTSKSYLDELFKLSIGVSMNGNNYNINMRNPLNQLSPRISASYAISDKIDINANVGRYTMQPSYTTLGYRNATGILVNQNENLKYIISNQAILGFEYRPTQKMRMSLEGFYKQYGNYTLSVTDGLSTASKGTDFGQVGDEEIVSTGKGRAYGIELLFKIMEINNLNLTLTSTLFRSEFTNENGFYLPSSWDTKYVSNLTANYKLPKNWGISVRQRFVGGVPFTPINYSYSSIKQVWNIQNQPYLDYNNFNSLRLRPSHILDFRLDKEFYFNKWLLNVYTDIQNIYNFQSQSAPMYTNLDISGNPIADPNDDAKYQLRKINISNGTILPTIGIIVKM